MLGHRYVRSVWKVPIGASREEADSKADGERLVHRSQRFKHRTRSQEEDHHNILRRWCFTSIGCGDSPNPIPPCSSLCHPCQFEHSDLFCLGLHSPLWARHVSREDVRREHSVVWRIGSCRWFYYERDDLSSLHLLPLDADR